MNTSQGAASAADRSAWASALELLPDALAVPLPRRLEWVVQLDRPSAVLEILNQLLDQREALERANFLGQTAGREFGDDPVTSTQELESGRVIGRYRLLDILGSGGMSVVWRAEQQDESFSRVVALKFPRHAGLGLARRLQREKRILAALEHASIARLYDVGVTLMGLPFIAMEYVAGVPLDQWCRDKSLSLTARLDLLLQVLEAVQYAHAQLVLHRDIKPSNILVDATGSVRLLDFGIAKVLQSDNAESAPTELTQDAGSPMTPAYASPEQLRAEPLSVRSDVYALGVLMYELLTGTLPFLQSQLGSRQSAAEGDLPQLPSRRAAMPTADAVARGFAQDLRGDLDSIIMRALDPRPSQRYGSAAGLHDDLVRHLRHEPVFAVPPRRTYVAGRFIRRHRVIVSASVLSVAALCAGTAIALAQAARAADEAARARAVSSFLVDVFQASSIDTVDAGMARRQTAQELLGQGAKRLVDGSLDHGPSRRELQRVLSGLLDDLAMTDEAVAVRGKWLKELQDSRSSPESLAEVVLGLARSRTQQGDHGLAFERLTEVRRLLDGSSSRAGDALKQQAKLLEGQLALRNGDAARAKQTLADISRAGHPASVDDEARASWLELQAGIANVEGRTNDAAALLHQTVALHEQRHRRSPARLAIALYAVSNNLWEIGRAEDAWTLLARAHDLAQTAQGPEHISTVLMTQQLGRLLVYRGELAAGLGRLRQSADQLRGFAGRIEPTALVRSQDYLVEALMANGRYREALSALEEVKVLTRGAPPLPFDASLYHDVLRARVYTDVGRYKEALNVLKDVEQAVVQRLGAEGPAWMDVQTRVLETLRASGSQQPAWTLLEQLDKRCQANKDLQAQFGADLKLTRVAMLLDRGDGRRAEEILRPAAAATAPTPWQQADVATRWRQGRLSLQLGHAAQAEQAFQSVVKDMSSHGYAYDPSIAEARGYLAQAQFALGRAKEARENLVRAHEALRREAAGPHFARSLRQLPGAQDLFAVSHN